MTRSNLLGIMAMVMTAARSISAATVTPDIEYGRAGDVSLRLDASTPDGPGPFPVAIVIHGGGWGSGDKRDDPAPLLAALSDAKFVWFSINYRLAPQHRWPACLDDVNAAVRWAKANAAACGGDPARVALVGYSAGGQLACYAAATATPETAVRAVVAVAPPTDFELDLPRRGGLSIALQNLLGRPKEVTAESRQLLRDLSPVHRIRPGLPPFLLMHGTADKSVPYGGSVTFVGKLKAADVPAELITIEGAPHRLSEWGIFDKNFGTKMTAWLARQLVGPAKGPTP